MTITELIRECHLIAVDHGFWGVSQNIPEKVMLIVTELAEAVEAYRKDNINDRDGVAEELADAVIRIFDLAGQLGIDLESKINWKVDYNRGREYLHGKRF